MDNRCSVCEKGMTGRADRKFCSAACRQKAYRQGHEREGGRNVTAESYEIESNPSPHKEKDPFWLALSQVPDILADLKTLDGEIDPEDYGQEPGWKPKVSLYPPRRKNAALAELDMKFGKLDVTGFLSQYDEMIETMARVRATAEKIANHHGWG